MTEQTLFLEAIAKPPEERARFLDQACVGQPELRAAMEALLAAHAKSGDLAADPPVGVAPTIDSEQRVHPRNATQEHARSADDSSQASQSDKTADYQRDVASGVVIVNRYTLLKKLGEGGMGEVWAASQSEPVKRKVALKLIKAGMDSRAVLTRFEQERQALALMDHPNIARVLDGGMTLQRPAVLRDGTRQWSAPSYLLRRGQAFAQGATGVICPDLSGGPACTPKGNRPS